MAILGQNGSGKSTLVRLLSTLLLHDGGSAHVFGHDVFIEPKPVQKLVNRVSVEASFFKKMSAAENLGYAARFYGMTSRETRIEIPRILERVGFPPDSQRADGEPEPRHAAEGRARAGAAHQARAAAARRATTGLDPRSKLEVQEFIREVRRQHDATILLCTHDLNEAEGLADRIGILDRGELLVLEPGEDAEAPLRQTTLEEAFFAATGRTFEDEVAEDDDEEREVFA